MNHAFKPLTPRPGAPAPTPDPTESLTDLMVRQVEALETIACMMELWAVKAGLLQPDQVMYRPGGEDGN